jgi:hypothetical protein
LRASENDDNQFIISPAEGSSKYGTGRFEIMHFINLFNIQPISLAKLIRTASPTKEKVQQAKRFFAFL